MAVKQKTIGGYPSATFAAIWSMFLCILFTIHGAQVRHKLATIFDIDVDILPIMQFFRKTQYRLSDTSLMLFF